MLITIAILLAVGVLGSLVLMTWKAWSKPQAATSTIPSDWGSSDDDEVTTLEQFKELYKGSGLTEIAMKFIWDARPKGIKVTRGMVRQQREQNLFKVEMTNKTTELMVTLNRHMGRADDDFSKM